VPKLAKQFRQKLRSIFKSKVDEYEDYKKENEKITTDEE
jgi:hypothetical protein